MRIELEAAMGRAITSRAACDRLLASPSSYAESFGLDHAEAEALAAMKDDLASLMPSFVTKRQRTLQGGSRRTLGLLGEFANGLVEAYSEAHPPVDLVQEDQRAFADFLVRETAALADSIEHGAIIAEMARFERLERAAFAASAPLSAQDDGGTRSASAPFDAERRLRPRRGAAVGYFGYDLRQLWFASSALPHVPVDPCALLCYHRGMLDGTRVIRIDDELARAWALLVERPEGVSPSSLCETLGTARGPDALLGDLVGQGALRWV